MSRLGLLKNRNKITKKRKKPLARRRRPPSWWQKFVFQFRRFGIYSSITFIAIWLIAIAFVSGSFGKAGDYIYAHYLTLTVNMGFKVDDILITGRQYTDPELLRALLNTERGDPILGFDPEHAKELIEKITWVQTAYVARQLPGTIYIEITERKPLAIWQEKDTLRVIDYEGHVLTDENLEEFNTLPIIVGSGAPNHVAHLVNILNAEPIIADRLDAAIRIGQRRWDLKLYNGIKIKLPERDVELAIRTLVKKHEENNLLDENITSIDLRNSDKLIIKAKPGVAQQILNGSSVKSSI